MAGGGGRGHVWDGGLLGPPQLASWSAQWTGRAPQPSIVAMAALSATTCGPSYAEAKGGRRWMRRSRRDRRVGTVGVYQNCVNIDD